MPKTVADYEDAVRRIAKADVPNDATTQAEVRAALAAAQSPQVTREIADQIADSIVTEDRVIEAIQETGELPTEGEIDAITDVADDYDLDDRVGEIADAVSDRIATVDEVEQAVAERQDQAAASNRPTFREDVEGAVDNLAQDQEFVGQSPDDVADQQAREIGAPTETAYRRAATQTIAQSDQVTPSDVVEGTSAKTPVQVIRDSSGDAIAATGGPSDEIGQQVADSLGTEYMDTEAVVDEMGTAGTGDRVDLTLRGRSIGEVDV